MATITLDTAPQYQKLTGNNTYNLDSEIPSSGRGTVPQLPKCFDIDTTAGVVTINLMSISSLFEQGGFGVGFGIFYTWTAGGSNIVWNAFVSEGDSDTICGNSQLVVTAGAGTAGMIHVAGRHNWLHLSCLTIPSVI